MADTYRARLHVGGIDPGDVLLIVERTAGVDCDPALAAVYQNFTWWHPRGRNRMVLRWTAEEFGPAHGDLPCKLCVSAAVQRAFTECGQVCDYQLSEIPVPAAWKLALSGFDGRIQTEPYGINGLYGAFYLRHRNELLDESDPWCGTGAEGLQFPGAIVFKDINAAGIARGPHVPPPGTNGFCLPDDLERPACARWTGSFVPEQVTCPESLTGEYDDTAVGLTVLLITDPATPCLLRIHARVTTTDFFGVDGLSGLPIADTCILGDYTDEMEFPPGTTRADIEAWIWRERSWSTPCFTFNNDPSVLSPGTIGTVDMVPVG